MSARLRSCSSALTLHMPPLLCYMPWAPMPRTLQRWLYQPCQQIRCWQGPRPWQVQCPQLAALPLIHACQHPGVRLPLCPCRPSQLCQAHGLIFLTAQPTCGPVQRLHRCQHCWPHTPSLHQSHITIILPCLSNATSHITVAAADYCTNVLSTQLGTPHKSPPPLMHSPWHSHFHWFHCVQHPQPLEHVPTWIPSRHAPLQVRFRSRPPVNLNRTQGSVLTGSGSGFAKSPELNPKSSSRFRKIYPEPN